MLLHVNSFWMASCHFLHDLRQEYSQTSWNVWVPSLMDLVSLPTMEIVAKSIKKVKLSSALFSLAARSILCWHLHYTKLANFSLHVPLWIECGLGDHFKLILNLTLEMNFFHFLNTFRISNCIMMIIITFIMRWNHFTFSSSSGLS